MKDEVIITTRNPTSTDPLTTGRNSIEKRKKTDYSQFVL